MQIWPLQGFWLFETLSTAQTQRRRRRRPGGGRIPPNTGKGGVVETGWDMVETCSKCKMWETGPRYHLNLHLWQMVRLLSFLWCVPESNECLAQIWEYSVAFTDAPNSEIIWEIISATCWVCWHSGCVRPFHPFPALKQSWKCHK